MKVYIHSSGRAGRCSSFDYLPDATILVQADQYDSYERQYPGADIQALPPHIKTLSPTRQWILDNCPDNKVLMLDDDLRFSARKILEPTKFRPAVEADVVEMVQAIDKELDEYAHVGVLARDGANRILEPHRVTVTRMMRLLAYNLDTVRKVGARFDRVITKQDFDMTLQLLEAGYANSVLTQWCHDQPGSNTAGGCSIYRTSEVMAQGAHDLHSLHPKYVKVVEKQEVGTWGGSRLDVQIQWKKAYNDATQN